MITEEQKQKKLQAIKETHPVDSVRWYFGKKCQVIGYEVTQEGYIYVICNVEDPYKGGFVTKYLTPHNLKKK